MRRPRHRMRRLAAALTARRWDILRRIAPGDVALFPRHVQQLGCHAMNVEDRLGAKVADAGLDRDTTVRLDHEQPVEPHRSGRISADRNADTANRRPFALAGSRLPRFVLKEVGSPVQSLLQERAGRVIATACRVWTAKRRLPLRRVDPVDGHLIDAELVRGPRQNGFHEPVALHAAWSALRAARRRVGED